MAEDIEIKLNKRGFRAIMQGDEVFDVLNESSRGMLEMARSIGGADVNYLQNVQVGRVSLHGMVATGDRHAQRNNEKYDTLRKSIDGGRV